MEQWNVEHKDGETVKRWNSGEEHWNGGTIERQNSGMVEEWKGGTLKMVQHLKGETVEW